MKTYKVLKQMPWRPTDSDVVITKDTKWHWNVDWVLPEKSLSDMFDVALAEWWRLEEIKKHSYIVTEEWEIIWEYEGECWYVHTNLEIFEFPCCENTTSHFITKEQAEAYVKREKARRELWQLYYENGYEENKGECEVIYLRNSKSLSVDYSKSITNISTPHCNGKYHELMLELPRVQEIYKIIFGIDG